MVFRIILFGILLFGTVLLERKFLQPIGLELRVILYCAGLLCAYLILLYLEIRSKVYGTANWKQLRWRGFHFGFWAGVFWGIFIASPGFNSLFADPVRFAGDLAGCFAWGIISGIVGMAITQFMLLLIFKLPEEK